MKTILEKKEKSGNGKWLKQKLESYDITTKVFSDEVGFSHKTVRRWVNGSLDIPDAIADQVLIYSMSRIISSDGKDTIRAKRVGDFIWSRKGRPVHPKGVSTKEINRKNNEHREQILHKNPKVLEFKLHSEIANETGLSYKIIRETRT